MDIYTELRRRGIARAVVHFSGGNDEGGVDAIDFYAADETKLDFDIAYASRAPHVHDEQTGQWIQPDGHVVYTGEYHDPEPGQRWKRPKTRPATAEEIDWTRFYDALGEPVYARYGGFAGDFSVHGTVTYDVEERTTSMSGAIRSDYTDFQEQL